MTTDFTEEKQLASGWFRSLRDQIVAAFEALEETHSEGPFNGRGVEALGAKRDELVVAHLQAVKDLR